MPWFAAYRGLKRKTRWELLLEKAMVFVSTASISDIFLAVLVLLEVILIIGAVSRRARSKRLAKTSVMASPTKPAALSPAAALMHQKHVQFQQARRRMGLPSTGGPVQDRSASVPFQRSVPMEQNDLPPRPQTSDLQSFEEVPFAVNSNSDFWYIDYEKGCVH